MDFRKSQWTESISSLLRKTEMNLIRIQTPYHEELPRSYTSMTYQASFYENPIADQPQRPQTDYKDDSVPYIQQDLVSIKTTLEKMLQDRLKSQKKEIEEIGERLVSLEVGSQELDKFKEETRNSLFGIEKKCLAEIKRIESSAKGFVSHDDLKITTDAIKNANINQLKILENSILEIKNGDLEVKEEVFKIAEEKIREMSKKFLSLPDFEDYKASLSRDSAQQFKDFEFNLQEKLEIFRLENQKQNFGFEQRIEEVSKKYEKKEESLFRKIQEMENNFEKINGKYLDDIKNLKAEVAQVQELINTEDIESDIALLKKQIESIPKQSKEPDLSQYASKSDYKLLMDKVQESLSIKQSLEQKISELEKKIVVLEQQLSESEEADFELGPESTFVNKGGATFGKTELPEQKSEFTKIYLNDLGDSDSESHGYISPHTSPMNQLPIGRNKPEDKKNNQFDFKQKTGLHNAKTDLIMIDENPEVENKGKTEKDPDAKKIIVQEIGNKKVDIKSTENLLIERSDSLVSGKVEVKQFPVDSLKIDKKTLSEPAKPEIKRPTDLPSIKKPEEIHTASVEKIKDPKSIPVTTPKPETKIDEKQEKPLPTKEKNDYFKQEKEEKPKLDLDSFNQDLEIEI